MKMFLAYGGGELYRKHLKNVPHILVSYYAMRTYTFERNKKWWQSKTLFLDSGGFTAQTQKVQIDVRLYGDYIKQHKDLFRYYANLDPASPEETYQNYKALLSMGLKPLPIYRYFDHQDREYCKVIEEYCRTCDYICIGGLASAPGKLARGRYEFYDYVFHYAVKHDTKVHAFGIADSDYLTKYPFYSFDTLVWLEPGMYGTLRTFDPKRGKVVCCPLRRKNLRKDNLHKLSRRELLLMQSSDVRIAKAVESLLEFEDYLTRLWEKRGVVWND